MPAPVVDVAPVVAAADVPPVVDAPEVPPVVDATGFTPVALEDIGALTDGCPPVGCVP
jgi:hypothetical protein